MAVQANGAALAFQWSTKRSIRRTNSFTLGKEPRRMARWVMMLNQISTWLSQEA